ncbi:hypothetical protein [Telluria beijingensis]|uniref:hypothetical protein n=1 Tax=Telluria beijingensis TaxID=3068633 RepID=UPI002796190F|nr:hypothetical protein [Massilia sp. REN29]
MSHILAANLPLPVLLALVASLLVSLVVAAVAVSLHRPAPVRLPARDDERAAVSERD